MKNLGKLLLLLLVVQNYLYSSVVAQVDSTSVDLGDTLTLRISVEGEDIKRPALDTVCGEDVIATGSSTSLQYSNGETKKTYILSYKFMPTKDCVIEPVSILVDGDIQKTEAINIKVEKNVATKDSDFSLELKTDVKEVYVGEPFELIVLLRQKKSIQILDNKFTQPSFKGFWVKGEPTQVSLEDGSYVISKITYLLAPQREGELGISSANIKIARRENSKNYFGGFFPEVKWRTYFSNDLNITVKPLPNGVNLVGDLNIEAFVDKTEVNPNEVINLTIKVQGEGNLEDIKSFKPYIDGVSIFDEKITIAGKTLSQKITFVGDSSFVIPSFSLKVFDAKTKKVKVITTNAIKIKVNNAKKKEVLSIQRGNEEKVLVVASESSATELKSTYVIMAVLFGVVLGVLLMLVKPYLSVERKKKLDLKDTKLLLVKLMPYNEDKEVQNLVKILENNLYSQEKIIVDKKALKEIINKYKIS